MTKQRDILKFGKERGAERELHVKMEMQMNYGTELCGTLGEGNVKMTWPQIANFLDREYPETFIQFLDTDDDGFVMVGAKGGNFFDYWVRCQDLQYKKELEEFYGGTSHRDAEARRPRGIRELLLPTANIWDFTKAERRLVLKHWEKALQQDWIDNLVAQAQGHQRNIRELDTLKSEYQRRILETADVIGLTTTGLARNASLLQRVNSKTLICEEAGEVLEAILTLCKH